MCSSDLLLICGGSALLHVATVMGTQQGQEAHDASMEQGAAAADQQAQAAQQAAQPQPGADQ